MKLFLSWILILSEIFGLSGCSSMPVESSIPSNPTTPIVSSYNETVNKSMTSFGIDLLKNVRNKDQKSVLVSPLSVTLALSMVANGADGETLKQFESVLGDKLSINDINNTCKFISDKYENLGGTSESIIANSLWVDPKGQIKDEFIAKGQDVFNAEVRKENLSNPNIVSNLNGWVNEKTKTLIPIIIDKPFEDSTVLVLVNAIYLKNTWAREFDANDTYKREFNHLNGSKESIDFLNHHNRSFSYISGKDVEGVILPYDDEKLGFVVLMPKDLESYVSNLNVKDWNSLIKGAKTERFLSLGLPKFEQDWKDSLKEILKQMGLNSAFSPSANFSLLGNDQRGYSISDVVHATKIKVNEKGTEAAAVTMVTMDVNSAMEPQGKILVFDHPFIYGIVDLETNFPLFLGTFE